MLTNAPRTPEFLKAPILQGPGPVNVPDKNLRSIMNPSQPNRQNIPTFEISNQFLASFSVVTEINATPKRDQGLIMDCADNLTITDYACAIGNLVGPKNVVSAAKISNNRICVYVANKHLVTEITDKYQTIDINELKVTVRPLISRLKKIVLSNVPTDIPNCIIENVLDQIGVKRCAPITTLKATIAKEDYSHVTCFRRQTYVNPDDIKLIPELFVIRFQEMDFHIFASTDTIKCFHCKQLGHLARYCTNINTNENTTENQTNTNITDNSKYPQVTDKNKTPTTSQTQTGNKLMENKRTHSDICSSDSRSSKEKNKQKKKKNTTENISESPDITDVNDSESSDSQHQDSQDEDDLFNFADELDNKLKHVKTHLEGNKELINYMQFKSIVENTKGIKNPSEIILEHTPDIQAFLEFMEKIIYPNCNNKSIRQTCTSLRKRLVASCNITKQSQQQNI